MMFYVLTSQNRDYLAWLHWKIRSQEYSFDLIRSFQMVIYNDFPFNSSIFVRAMFDYQTVKTSTKAPTTEMHGKCPVKFPPKKTPPLARAFAKSPGEKHGAGGGSLATCRGSAKAPFNPICILSSQIGTTK